MKIVLLLVLLTVSECGSISVVGQTGQNVTLSCKYNFKYYGELVVCWGRGDIPSKGCTNQLISTDGRRVIEGTRASSRYQLLGRLDEGDVSLTILNFTDSDAGRYGCRVEIPGWFNDDKHHFDLTIETVSECGSISVVGQTGQNVTLSCKYNFKYYGALAVCWGRGDIPSSGCTNKLVSTDGRGVIEGTRASSRYQLLGRLDEGDVSLTILNLTDSDAGRYGCRVAIPGWFNDDKHHFDLTIETDPQTNTSTSNTETSTEQPAAKYTSTSTSASASTGHMNFTETLLTSSSSSVSAEQENSIAPVVLVCALFVLIALVTAGGLVIIIKRWTLLHKTPRQQQGNSWAWFNSTSSSLHIHRSSSAVENVYQIDGGGDGGEYEYCP
ncbi:uncharacterized protein LOC119031032 isoform X1 [Acanthopagrus latus]|uniref:uncharacterized protein LOC119031032 isoform X1 n=1 Tax=Acanthopagrus latus TaxID=8177 RepID=UPI00187CA2FB|nr:uncharacterized protein LOC119031032 isoform X1 [Acanthopagrus latus]